MCDARNLVEHVARRGLGGVGRRRGDRRAAAWLQHLACATRCLPTAVAPHGRYAHGLSIAHSSVLRVSSPHTTLWTHYDTHDNLLVQVYGQKTVVLWPPSAEPFLYVEGSSSRVDDISEKEEAGQEEENTEGQEDRGDRGTVSL